MMNKEVLPIEGIIARLDNDFNIMTSDYIPRVATWCIDAMNEMGILQYEKKEMVTWRNGNGGSGESAYIGSTGKPAGNESVSSSEADR